MDLRSLLLFALTFTLIVAVHEFGHYITARLLGMRVLEFAFGFPPKIVGITHAGILYSINAIPFGGFVRILGQDDFDPKATSADPMAFTSKSWIAQSIVLVAGVVMNFLLALILLTGAFLVTGQPEPTGQIRVAEVQASSPAAAAKLQVGDVITRIDGKDASGMANLVNYTRRRAEKELTLTIMRENAAQEVTLTPRADPPDGQGPLGIKIEDVTVVRPIGLAEAMGSAMSLTGSVAHGIANLPAAIFEGTAGAQVGGPIEIYRVTKQVSEVDTAAFLKLVGILSVNLGIVNILPFPGLDGGRLLFVLISGIFKRQLSPKAEGIVHLAGFLFLLAVLILVSINDVSRIIKGG